jgi:hypothetical protein
MLDSENADVCDFCGKGHVVKRSEDIAFHQETDRGTISCKVTISIGICDRCGMKTWDAAADSIIEEAVRREIDKLE